MFAVGSWVSHSEGEGIVVGIVPGYEDSHAVQLLNERRLVYAREAELTSMGTLPPRNVGDTVSFGGRSGQVIAVQGEVYTIEVSGQSIRTPVLITRLHLVPRWMLELG